MVAASGLVPLNLPENEQLRCFCGLVLGSRAIKFPQFCYGGRERRMQSLHHKWLNRRSLNALHGSLAGPAPGLRRTATGMHRTASLRRPGLLFCILPSSFFIHVAAPCRPHTAPIPPGLLQSAPGGTKAECRMQNAECRMQNAESRGRLCPAMRENRALPRAIPKPTQCDIKATSKPPQCVLLARR